MAELAISAQEIANREHIAPPKTGDNIAAKRVAVYVWDPTTNNWVRSTGGGSSSVILNLYLDNTSTASTVYIGKAPTGTATSAALWQIFKLNTSSGLIKTWAGAGAFNQIWDNRTSLTYS